MFYKGPNLKVILITAGVYFLFTSNLYSDSFLRVPVGRGGVYQDANRVMQKITQDMETDISIEEINQERYPDYAAIFKNIADKERILPNGYGIYSAINIFEKLGDDLNDSQKSSRISSLWIARDKNSEVIGALALYKSRFIKEVDGAADTFEGKCAVIRKYGTESAVEDELRKTVFDWMIEKGFDKYAEFILTTTTDASKEKHLKKLTENIGLKLIYSDVVNIAIEKKPRYEKSNLATTGRYYSVRLKAIEEIKSDRYTEYLNKLKTLIKTEEEKNNPSISVFRKIERKLEENAVLSLWIANDEGGNIIGIMALEKPKKNSKFVEGYCVETAKRICEIQCIKIRLMEISLIHLMYNFPDYIYVQADCPRYANEVHPDNSRCLEKVAEILDLGIAGIRINTAGYYFRVTTPKREPASVTLENYRPLNSGL